MAEKPEIQSVKKKNMVDLEAMVEKWAWLMFDKARTRKQKKLKKKQLDFQIDWKKVKFVHGEPDYSKPQQQRDQPPVAKQKAQILFKTQFLNNTEQEQEYSFKTERTTRSTCTVEVVNGVCMGYETSICLKTPLEVLEANAGFKREVEVTNTDSQTMEEEIIWAVDSQIKVRGKTKTIAELVVDERCDKNDYDITTHLFGNVNVNISNKDKGNKHVTNIGGPIVEIIDQYATPTEKAILRVDRTKKLYNHTIVTYHTSGNCTFKFGVEQRVDLHEEKL